MLKVFTYRLLVRSTRTSFILQQQTGLQNQFSSSACCANLISQQRAVQPVEHNNNNFIWQQQQWTHANNVWSRNQEWVKTFPSLVSVRCFSTSSSPDRAGKSDSKAASASVAENDIFSETSKLGLFAKFKLMYKKYWYVMVPVHCVTSCFWFGGFYYMSKSGVDIPTMLQYLHLSESIIEKLQNSDMGHLAVAYLCYKIATPFRYAITLGGTTISIKYLVQMGYIKPIPSKEEFIQMYEQKKADRAAAKADRAAAKACKKEEKQQKKSNK